MIRETEHVGVESCNWTLAEADGFLQLNPNLIQLSQKKRKKKKIGSFHHRSFLGLLGPSLLSWIPHVEDQADTVTDGEERFCLIHQTPRKMEHMLSNSISCVESLRFLGLHYGMGDYLAFFL